MNPEAKKYLAAIGRRGGKSKSPDKIAAAKFNGLKGGRPKKRKTARTYEHRRNRNP
jgi:hypothetical protein